MMTTTTEKSARPVNAFDLSGRVALVTGAGSESGIGFAAARLLASMGASVLITSTTSRIEKRAEELASQGFDVRAVDGDLTVPSTAVDLVAIAQATWGSLDIVIHNAGMTSVSEPKFDNGSIEEMSFDVWRMGLSRNLDTSFHVAKAALTAMTQSGWGRLVMIGSVTGPVMAMHDEPAYAAAKAGMVGLARALAVDVASRGITVNAVAPGWTATGSQTPAEFEQGLRTPVGRSGTPEEYRVGDCVARITGSLLRDGPVHRRRRRQLDQRRAQLDLVTKCQSPGFRACPRKLLEGSRRPLRRA